jgi:tagatose-1,6-bisphosphate aldolase non-catalytic subunit AgaZ/GatZ
MQGLSIGFSHLGFRDVTLDGAMGTAAHGSSPSHSSVLAHRAVALTMVLWNGELKPFTCVWKRAAPGRPAHALLTAC